MTARSFLDVGCMNLNSVHGCCWCSQVQNLLLAYGSLKTFTLVKDPTTGQSAGQAYCEYVDASATEGAVSGLSTTVVAGAPLVARRVVGGENAVALQQLIAQQQAALVQRLAGKGPPLGAPVGLGGLGVLASTGSGAVSAPSPTVPSAAAAAAGAAGGLGAVGSEASQQQLAVEEKGVGLVVVQLENMVDRDDLLDDEEYEDVMEDTKGEVAKYGELVQVSSRVWCWWWW
jgi:splicing factor U2AF subunit